MHSKFHHILILLGIISACCSCTSVKTFTTNYYRENEKTLSAIESSFKKSYEQKAFSVGFNDYSFNYISLEIKTDSIKYIYEFEIHETRLQDSLKKYQMPAEAIMDLIKKMRSIKCTWINQLDYYSNEQKKSLVYISIHPVHFRLPFTSEKYFILTYYSQPQYFDNEGVLLASRRVRKLRKINGDIFHRINDKVCYTISESFRWACG